MHKFTSDRSKHNLTHILQYSTFCPVCLPFSVKIFILSFFKASVLFNVSYSQHIVFQTCKKEFSPKPSLFMCVLFSQKAYEVHMKAFCWYYMVEDNDSRVEGY